MKTLLLTIIAILLFLIYGELREQNPFGHTSLRSADLITKERKW